MPGKQRLFALTATGMLAQTLGRYAIYRMAMEANNVQSSHGMALLLSSVIDDMRPPGLKLNFIKPLPAKPSQKPTELINQLRHRTEHPVVGIV